jgi:hypothetical protein
MAPSESGDALTAGLRKVARISSFFSMAVLYLFYHEQDWYKLKHSFKKADNF